MTTTTQHEFLTIAEAAELLRVDPSTIRRWIKSGRLSALRPGPRTLRLRREDVVGLQGIQEPVDEEHACDGDVPPWRRPLSAEEIERRLAVLEQLRVLREEQRERYGVFDVPGWELLHEAREERDRQLMGDE